MAEDEHRPVLPEHVRILVQILIADDIVIDAILLEPDMRGALSTYEMAVLVLRAILLIGIRARRPRDGDALIVGRLACGVGGVEAEETERRVVRVTGVRRAQDNHRRGGPVRKRRGEVAILRG
jgi:hypothetical protein